MKKIISTVFFVFLLTGCSFASQDSINTGYISVNTEAVNEFASDYVNISFAIETHSNDSKTAAEENKNMSQNVINALKAVLGEDETIKTVSYNLSPEYNYKDGSRKLKGYRAYNTLQVGLQDVDKAGKIISIALANGANSVSRLQYSLKNTNDLCTELIQTASKAAQERANKTAQTLNTRITGIKSINASCSSSQIKNTSLRMLNSRASVEDSDENTAIPLESGKNELRAIINAEFFVK